jgi:hypothetical protein
MNESLREAAVADLMADLRRLSTLERDFLHRWRCALGVMSSTPQLAQVFDQLQRLAALEAKAQRDQDADILAAIENVEFTRTSPGGGDRWIEGDHGAERGGVDDADHRHARLGEPRLPDM